VKPAALRVQSALRALGLEREVIELAVDARTSQQAADALGVNVGQIAKSLVFTLNGRPLLVIASGANRVDEAKLGKLVGGVIRRADPETVKQATGFTIGGVAPLGHPAPLPVYIDPDLLQYELIYAAAGVSECVFPLTPAELVRGTGGRVVDVKEDRSIREVEEKGR
jgi:prolyl-tRNA editing enzyme YbaK/EbsC (Cys-tRNA(Pro) deacylase)